MSSGSVCMGELTERTSSSSSVRLTSPTDAVVEKNSSEKHMFPTRIASRSSAQRQGSVSFHEAGHSLRKPSSVLLSGRLAPSEMFSSPH